MANGLNQCTFCGNLGDDPDFRVTTSGRGVLRFRIACSEPRRQQDGSWGQHTEWIPIVVWGNRAEGLNKFLAKGHNVIVTGKFRTRKYQDRDGNDRWTTEIQADDVLVPGGRRDGSDSRRRDNDGGERRATTRRRQNNQDDPPRSSGEGGGYDDADYGPGDGDDDIPF